MVWTQEPRVYSMFLLADDSREPGLKSGIWETEQRNFCYPGRSAQLPQECRHISNRDKQNDIQVPQPLVGICNLFGSSRSLRSARSYVLCCGRFVFDRPLAGGKMVEFPKLAAIENCSSRTTL